MFVSVILYPTASFINENTEPLLLPAISIELYHFVCSLVVRYVVLAYFTGCMHFGDLLLFPPSKIYVRDASDTDQRC